MTAFSTVADIPIPASISSPAMGHTNEGGVGVLPDDGNCCLEQYLTKVVIVKIMGDSNTGPLAKQGMTSHFCLPHQSNHNSISRRCLAPFELACMPI